MSFVRMFMTRPPEMFMSQRKGGIIHDPSIRQIGNCKQRRDHCNRLHREQPVFEERVIIMSVLSFFRWKMNENRDKRAARWGLFLGAVGDVSF
jgi:hypothetical protein